MSALLFATLFAVKTAQCGSSSAAAIRLAAINGDDVRAAELGQHASSTEELAWYLASLARSGWRTRALDEAKALTRAHPDDPWAWLALSVVESRDPFSSDRGVAAAKRIASTCDDFVAARAEALVADARYKDAIELADAHPNSTALLVAKARALVNSSYTINGDPTPRLESALAALAKAREIDPNSVPALLLTARTLNDHMKRQAEATPFIERALQLAPNAVGVHAVYWDILNGDKERIHADIKKLLDAQPNDPATLQRAAQQYQNIGDNDDAAKLRARIVEVAPDSPQADTVRYLDATKVPKAERSKALRAFIAHTPHPESSLVSSAYARIFEDLAADPASSPDELLEAMHGSLKGVHNDAAYRYSHAAIVLADHGVALDEAQRVVRRGFVATAAEEVRDRRTMRPAEAADYRKSNGAQLHDALGWVLFKRGKLDEARKQLDLAARAYPNSPNIVFHRGKLAEAQGELNRAAEAYARGYGVPTRDVNPNTAALQALYKRRHGSLDGFGAYVEKVKADSANRRRSEVLRTRLDPPRPVRDFKSAPLIGPPFDESALRGKVTVVNFWGVWCGACVAEMPDLVKVVKNFKGDRDVQFITVDSDDPPEKVQKWIAEKKYDLRVLRADDFLRRSGIRGFPTTWFLDRRGRIAYEITGASPDIIDQFTWRIESLK